MKKKLDKTVFLEATQENVFKPAELRRFARDWIEQNPQLFSSLKTAYTRLPRPIERRGVVGEDVVTIDEIRRVVQKNILDEYDHPQIVEAVTEYLYDHFMRSH